VSGRPKKRSGPAPIERERQIFSISSECNPTSDSITMMKTPKIITVTTFVRRPYAEPEAEIDPVDHHHRQAHVVEATAHQLAERHPHPLDERARD
jgi:hypothetical protein